MSNSYKPGFKLSLITTQQELAALGDEIKKSKSVCINVQGTDIDPMISSCAGISLAVDQKQVYFIPRQTNGHDQLVISVEKSDLEQTQKIVKDAMISAVAWECPLQIKILTGNNWKDVTIV